MTNDNYQLCIIKAETYLHWIVKNLSSSDCIDKRILLDTYTALDFALFRIVRMQKIKNRDRVILGVLSEINNKLNALIEIIRPFIDRNSKTIECFKHNLNDICNYIPIILFKQTEVATEIDTLDKILNSASAEIALEVTNKESKLDVVDCSERLSSLVSTSAEKDRATPEQKTAKIQQYELESTEYHP